MDLLDMDKAPLNKAHQLERKAEQLNRQNKFDECIECHKEAAECLSKCLECTDNPVSLDSVQRQKDWNERQMETVLLKKNYTLRMQKLKEAASSNNVEAIEKLQYKLFCTMETHDSLISYLGKRDGDTVDAIYKINEHSQKEELPLITGNKHPKGDAQVIEELKLLSNQLRESIRGLLLQLEDRNKEIERLKERIKTLEDEKQRGGYAENKQLPAGLQAVIEAAASADSSGGTSPYVYSPLLELLPHFPDGEPSRASRSPTREELDVLNVKFDALSSACSQSGSSGSSEAGAAESDGASPPKSEN